jgi:hypothetical protein
MGHLLMSPPCVVSTEFAVDLFRVFPGQEVLVVSDGDEWDMISTLAFEKYVVPWPVTQLNDSEHPSAELAIVRGGSWHSNQGWREIQQARGWIMASRSAKPVGARSAPAR